MGTLLKEIGVGSAYGTWYLRLYEDNISQNIANNTSTIALRLTMRCSMSGATISFDSRDAWINTTHFTPAYTQTAAEHDLGSTTVTIGHNADGTGSYSVGFGITTSYIISGSSTAGRTLPTIPRASSISSISGSSLGAALTVNISRASSSFTHKVKYQFGSIVREYTGQATACTFTPPLSDASQIPSTYYGAALITVTTYNGSTQIGNPVTSSVTLYLPASVLPTFTSLTEAKVNTADIAAWNKYVQNKSKATLKINGAAGIYGSTIKSYLISGPGFSSTASSATTGILTQSGNITFTAIITDTRDRTAIKSVTIAVVSNGLPSLSLKAERCTSASVVDNAGTYIKISPVYNCASVDGKNAIASKSFKITGTSYADTTVASGSFITLGANAIAVSKSYEVTGVVTDVMGQTSGTIKVIVPSSAVPFNLRNDGTGAAFGKYSETANRLDSAWPIVAPRVMVGLLDQTYANSISAETMLTNNWFRSIGATGWYSQTYNGGIHMTDTTWVRVYGGKKFYVANADGDAIYTSGGVKATGNIATSSNIDCAGTIYCHGSAWLGNIYSPGGASQWLGFYNAYGGTRKGWIGHNGSTTYNIYNEQSGGRTRITDPSGWVELYASGHDSAYNFRTSQSYYWFDKRIAASSFFDNDTGFTCMSSSNVRFLRHVQDARYLEIGTYVNGAFGVYYNVSDIAFKKNITPTSIINARSLINKLEHVQFDWKDDSSHVELGYIANDVKEIMPGLVFNVKQPDGGDQYNINQMTMLPLITKAMQEQDKIIKEQEKQISYLTEISKRSEERLCNLERLMPDSSMLKI